MGISVDASVTRFSGTGAQASATSGSFTPANNSLLVVCVNADAAFGGAITPTVTCTSAAATFTRRIKQDGAEDTGAYAAIFTAPITTGTSMTVTVGSTDGNSTSISAKIYIVTGQHASPIGTTFQGASTTNNYTPTLFTTTGAGRVFTCAVDWNELGTPSSTDTADAGDQPGNISFLSAYRASDHTASQSISGSFDAAGTAAADWNAVGLEILAAVTATPIGDPFPKPQRRTLYYPGRIIGAPRLGVGILAASAPNIPAVTGTGSAALNTFDASASGAEAFTGTGSAAAQPFAVSASGLVTFTGTASAALQPFDASGAGLSGVLVGPMAPPQPIARLWYPARIPMPPQARLGKGVLASGPVPFQGFAIADVQAFAVAASGLETYTGPASAAVQPFAVSASGTVSFSGSATAALQPFDVSASGSEGFLGSAGAALASFDGLGYGIGVQPVNFLPAAQYYGANVALSYPGKVRLKPPPRIGSGILAPVIVITGPASAALSSFAVDGVGTVGGGFIGTGSAALSPFAVTATGVETFTGTGSAALQPFDTSSSGSESFSGSGSAAAQPFNSSGAGISGDAITGPATAALSQFAVSSSGLETFSGAASAACSPFGITATGLENFAGSCTAALSRFACAATGLHIFPITGSASAAMQPFGCTASQAGLFINVIADIADRCVRIWRISETVT